MRMVVVLAAEPRAGAVLTAAGVLRAVMIVVTDDRVLTDAVVANAALTAVPIVAALGAHTSLGTPVLAAEQAIAAVELVVVIAAKGSGFYQATVVADVFAAIGLRNAFMAAAAGVAEQTQERMAGAIVTADLTVRAVGIAAALRIGALAGFVTNCTPRAVTILAAFGAGAGFAVDAAHQPHAALELRIVAGTRLRNANVHTLTQRHAFVIAAFLALAACAMAGTAITEFAGTAIRIVFTFRGLADAEAIGADVAAAVAVAIAAATVRFLGQPRVEAAWRAGNRIGVGIAMLLAVAIDTGFAVVAIVVVAALRNGALAVDALTTAALVAGAAAARRRAIAVVAGWAVLLAGRNALVADACVASVAVTVGAAGQVDALVPFALLTGTTIAIGATLQIDALVPLADLAGPAVAVGAAGQIDADAAFARLTGATIRA